MGNTFFSSISFLSIALFFFLRHTRTKYHANTPQLGKNHRHGASLQWRPHVCGLRTKFPQYTDPLPHTHLNTHTYRRTQTEQDSSILNWRKTTRGSVRAWGSFIVLTSSCDKQLQITGFQTTALYFYFLYKLQKCNLGNKIFDSR